MASPALAYLSDEERARLADLPSRSLEAKRLWNRAYYLAREGKRPAKQIAWDEANREKMKAYHREYSARWYAERKERVNAKNNAWRAANKEANAANNAAWKRDNRHKVAGYTAKRRAQEKLAVPKWADLDEIERVYEEAAAKGLHVDHIVPLVSKIVCGLHCPANLRPFPRFDNQSKSNRHWPDMP